MSHVVRAALGSAEREKESRQTKRGSIDEYRSTNQEKREKYQGEQQQSTFMHHRGQHSRASVANTTTTIPIEIAHTERGNSNQLNSNNSSNNIINSSYIYIEPLSRRSLNKVEPLLEASAQQDQDQTSNSFPVIQLFNFKLPFPFIDFEYQGNNSKLSNNNNNYNYKNNINNNNSNSNSKTINIRHEDSLRARLIAGNFLVLGLAISLIIFSCAICLLIYYRKHYYINKEEKVIKKRKKFFEQISIEPNNHKQPEFSNISQPFNIQMSPATRLRLDIMLKKNPSNKKERVPSKSVRSSMMRPVISSGRRDRMSTTIEIENMHNLNNNNNNSNSNNISIDSKNITNDYVDEHKEVKTNDEMHHYERVCSQPRAGKCKASPGARQNSHSSSDQIKSSSSSSSSSNRRGRNRKSQQYQPNLVSIPESELERHDLNGTVKGKVDTMKLLNQALNIQSDGEAIVSEDQFNALVKNAMNQTCSHLIQRMHENISLTLFSKPTNFPNGQQIEPVVSRSRILQATGQARDSL